MSEFLGTHNTHLYYTSSYPILCEFIEAVEKDKLSKSVPELIIRKYQDILKTPSETLLVFDLLEAILKDNVSLETYSTNIVKMSYHLFFLKKLITQKYSLN